MGSEDIVNDDKNKRSRNPPNFESPSKGSYKTRPTDKVSDDGIECEDPYGDDFESEEYDEDNSQEEEETTTQEEGNNNNTLIQPWRLGIDPIEEDEELQHDPTAYAMFHKAMLDWSCLSFDVVPDTLGQARSTFPHTVYVVAGTQAEKSSDNRLYMMKWVNLTKTLKDNNDSDNSENGSEDGNNDDAHEDGDPVLDFRFIQHPGIVNKVAVCPQLPRLVGTWSDNGNVYMWDMKDHFERLNAPGGVPNPKPPPKFVFSAHKDEGYALSFNPNRTGQIASGSNNGTVRVWMPIESGWDVTTKIKSHKASVEDVQWQRLNNPDILATCSVDKAIHFFDIRSSPLKPHLVIERAHTSDINGISWSPLEEHFLLSGGEDGAIKVWDMRNTVEPIVYLQWHKEPISSVDWHPTDSATFAASSLDNSVTLWDMSVEAGDTINNGGEGGDFPEQLMFQHMGQTHISSIKWHPQIPGVLITTAEDGFNIFKTCNV